MSSRPGRLGVGVVGVGRVGAVLASALRAAGHAIVGASGISAASLDRIDALLPAVPVLAVDEVVERSELVLLTVPDDVLPDLVAGLARLGRFQPGQLVVHTAGRYGIDVLAPARAAGAIPLAIHPAMTFTGTSLDLARLVGAPFAVTAAAPVLPIAQALVVEIGGEPVILPEESRGLYHAALAHGANHLVTLTAQAIRILSAAGVEEGGQLLTPLLRAALDEALRGGDQGLTGPVARGDAGTVAEHLRVLAAAHAADDDLVDVVPTYRALARATVQRSLVLGRLREAQAEELLDTLEVSTAAEPACALEPASAVEHPPREEDDGGTRVVHTLAELHGALGARPGTRAVVMTMGALHEGHLELVRQAQRHARRVVVTIFVNPLQFSAGEDFGRYPRTLDADVAALRAFGVDLVFAPAVEDMYPGGEPEVHLSSGRMGSVLEGAVRPGHFDGMLTVVHKVLNLVRPDVALFGQKDAQQLALVRRMVRDLDLGVEIVAVPIVRERDGLAISSRNVYLSPPERESALVLSRSVLAGARAAAEGASPSGVLRIAREVLDARDEALVAPDYLELVDPATMRPFGSTGGCQGPTEDGTAGLVPGLLVVAARVGATRLIDNAVIEWGDEPAVRGGDA